jgi:hypothetical protein
MFLALQTPELQQHFPGLFYFGCTASYMTIPDDYNFVFLLSDVIFFFILALLPIVKTPLITSISIA